MTSDWHLRKNILRRRYSLWGRNNTVGQDHLEEGQHPAAVEGRHELHLNLEEERHLKQQDLKNLKTQSFTSSDVSDFVSEYPYYRALPIGLAAPHLGRLNKQLVIAEHSHYRIQIYN